MESGKKSLEELTTAGVFHIPEFQRYYSWEEPECDDLWTDLSTLPDGKQHYFGTFIVQKTDQVETATPSDGYGGEIRKPVNLLIDGQQRLTTIALLVKSISERLEDIAEKTGSEAADEILDDVDDMVETFLVEDDVHFLKLLDETDDEYLQRIVEDRTLHGPERPSQRKMRDAKDFFDDRLEEFCDRPGLEPLEAATQLKKLWDTILDLELMVYVVEAGNPEKATLIFDSVNDRGRSLSIFDKTKSFLMRMAYLAAETEPEGERAIRHIRQAFGQMYDEHQRILDSDYVNDISDDAVQRYHFITYYDWTERADHQRPAFLENLKSRIRTLRREDPERCIQYVEEYVESLERGFMELANVLDYTADDEIAEPVERIHQLRHATKFYPILLQAWPHLDDEERRDLLKAIETFIFRVYAIGNHPTYTGRSALQTLARDTAADESVHGWLRGLVKTMSRYEDDDQFRRTLSSSDLYTDLTSQDLRYLFYFYDEHRGEQEGETGTISLDDALGDYYTIEHIWPQQPEELPIDDSGDYESVQQRYDAYKHRLGNLTLASRKWNAEWGNADFTTKRNEGYGDSKHWVQEDLREYDAWSPEVIEHREEELVESFVMQQWATPDTGPLTTKERYVLVALSRHSDGGVRGDVHETACSLADSPFDDPDPDGEERREVGAILERLAGFGWVYRESKTWYPTEEAQAVTLKQTTA